MVMINGLLTPNNNLLGSSCENNKMKTSIIIVIESKP